MIRPPACLVCLLALLLSVSWIHAQTPTLPNIPTAYTNNITSYGAVGDNKTTNTTAIQSAIDAAFAAGGGTVIIPSGTFLSGPLTFSNTVNLQLSSGAILRMLPYTNYPGTSDFIQSVSSGHDLEVSGSGIIDGQASLTNGWWTNNLSTSERPTLFFFNKCNRVLIQNVTLENPPSMHIVFKNGGANITIQGITINTPGTSPNTDGIDLVGTNCLVQNCSISDGDDCIALGSTGGTCSGILVTNCAFGQGHGMTIGGNTLGGVSNLMVINCSFNGTQYGIRLKSDNASASPGAGGITQNLFYYNLSMANIVEAPIVIYSYYNTVGTPIHLSPAFAADEPIPNPVPTTTCLWQNIVISNLTATVDGGGMAGVIWGRTELPATNVILDQVNITAPATFDVYNAYGIQFVNSQITVPAGNQTFTIFNAGIILSNDVGNITLNGLTSANSLALYNASLSTTAADIFGSDPVTVSDGTLSVGNNYTQPEAETFNFALGTSASTLATAGDLTFNNAVINVTNAPGFSPGLYTLFTYTGTASGDYALGNSPAGYNCLFYTNTVGEIQLLASPAGMSLTPTNLVAMADSGQLMVSWPTNHIGWFLEVQTNQTSVGLSTNWTFLPGSAATNTFSLPLNSTNGCVFLRLMYPN